MSTRTYLSIGDVLSLLRQEVPDITISKIRFLESQGLVNPERSPSGYRKFYEHDVERLRWVLRQQREHFLPLKVIRDRLARSGDLPAEGAEDFDEEAEAGDGVDYEAKIALDGGESTVTYLRAIEPAEVPEPSVANGSYEAEESDEEWIDQASDSRAGALATASSALAPRHAAVRTAQMSRRDPGPRPEEPAAPEPPARPERASASRSARGGAEPEKARSAPKDDPEPPRPKREPESTRVAHAALNATGASMTLDELCAASGLTASEVAALESFGLIEPLVVGGALYYDEEGLTVAKLVADFSRFGIEPRHLRQFRNAADRELGLIEQVVTPLLRQRNPEARQRALDSAADLARLGQSLHAAILRRALRQHLGA